MLTVRRMNVYTAHDSTFVMNRPTGLDCYLMLYTKVPAYFVLEGKEVEVPPESVLIYSPHTPEHYRPVGDRYENHWAHIEDDGFFESGNAILNHPIDVSRTQNIEKLFEMASFAFYSNNPDSKTLVNYLLKSLVLMLPKPSDGYGDTPHFSKLVELRHRIYNYPGKDYSIDSLANEFHMSRGYFQTLYKKAFGVPVSEDIIKSRIASARELLSDTDYTAKQIAITLGYKNQEHFFRQFKSLTGLTPKEYKRTLS